MKVFIVEDHEEIRIILKRLLRKRYPKITDIEESETGEEALGKIPSFDPALVLVDISLRGMDGIEMIRRLKPKCPAIRFLVVTGHEPEMYEQAAYEAGAEGVVSKYDDDMFLRSVGNLLAVSKQKGGDGAEYIVNRG